MKRPADLQRRAASRLAVLLVVAGLSASLQSLAAGAAIDVAIDGVGGELADNVRAYLSIVRYSQREDLSEALVRRLHRRAREEIRTALRPYGYYAPQISAELEQREGVWRARYAIEPGAPTLLQEIDIRVLGPGGGDEEFERAVEAAGLIPGEPVRHASYDRLKNDLQSIALRRGYLEARFTQQELQVNLQQRRADVQLHFATGPRYRFGEIRIDQDVLVDSFMRRLVGLHEGDYYDTGQLLSAEYALYDSGYFSVVDVAAEQDAAADLRVPVSVHVEARNPNRYSFGVGYGTDTQFRGTAAWENRRVNRRGHRMRVDLKLAQVGQDLRYRYVIPIGNPARERLSFSAAAINEEDIGDVRSERLELGATETRVYGSWQRNLFVLLNRETTTLAEEERTDTLLIPGISFSRTQLAEDATKLSSKLSVELRGSHVALGSDTQFAQLRLQGGLVIPAGERAQFVLRSEAGLSMVDEFSELPASQRFFAGGDRSVRGFGFNDLSPRDADGERIGGRHLLFGSVEFQHHIAGRWSGALFVDAGNAVNDLRDRLEYSVGIGIRWRSPVGPIRLDIGEPLTDSTGPRLHLSVGPEL